MLDKRSYYISLDTNGRYKIKSKGLIKTIRIMKCENEDLPESLILFINGREINVKYNEHGHTLYIDFSYIINQILSDVERDEDDPTDYHVLSMILLTANTKCISYYSHLPLKDLNESVFTHELEIEIKATNKVLPNEIKVDEEYYLPTFKLNQNKNQEEKEID